MPSPEIYHPGQESGTAEAAVCQTAPGRLNIQSDNLPPRSEDDRRDVAGGISDERQGRLLFCIKYSYLMRNFLVFKEKDAAEVEALNPSLGLIFPPPK
jgi:hypothetical protein